MTDSDQFDNDFLEMVRRSHEHRYYARNDFCNGRCKESRKPAANGDGIVVIKCIDCFFDEIISYNCLAKAGNGKRCGQEGRYGGYCRFHKDEYYAVYLERIIQHEVEKIERKYNLTSAKLFDIYYATPGRLRKKPKKTYVYFIQANNHIKIGYSINPQKRLDDLKNPRNKTIIPEAVDIQQGELLGEIIGGRETETLLHKRFSRHRVDGEWFKLNRRLRNQISRILEMKDSDIEKLIDDLKELEGERRELAG